MSLLGTIVKPPIPYVGGIPGGTLLPGSQIIIIGQIPHNSDGFGINLASGSAVGNTMSDTPFHFNPRFKENCVVRNSYKKNVWATEERLGGMPFVRNSNVEIVIYADLECFKISVNNKRFCDFTHRHPLHTVNTIVIGGSINVEFIKFIGLDHSKPQVNPAGAYQPNMMAYNPGGFVPPPQYHPPAPMAATGYPPATPPGVISNPIIPLTTTIPNGLHHGKMIYISGTPIGNRFTINFQEGYTPNSDIGLHYDVRLAYGSDKNVIVRNSMSAGNWQQEERTVPYFPYLPKQKFEMIILCENSEFKVAVNNQHLLEYRHRLTPFTRFNTLVISGDVKVTQVRFQ